jgi:hypothetical protein
VLAYLRYRLRLLQIGRKDRQRTRDFRREFASICRLSSEAERHEKVRVLAERDASAQEMLEVERLAAMTGYLMNRGDRQMLPYPPLDDQRYWRKRANHSLYFTREGIAFYRAQVEAQEKSQRERWAFYFGAATGLVGAITALAGLIVAWLSLGSRR